MAQLQCLSRTSVACCPNRDFVVNRLVRLESFREDLHELPHSHRGHIGSVRGTGWVLAGKRAGQGRKIGLGYIIFEWCDSERALDLIDGTIGQDIVGEPHLNRLINVQHVHAIVPRPRIQARGLTVDVDSAGAMFTQRRTYAGDAWTSLQPDGEGYVVGIITRAEEPEECVDWVIATPRVWVWRKSDVTRV